MTPHEMVQQGKPIEALEALKERIKADAANPKLRLFYFQLLAVLGDWERSIQQLKTLASMDPMHIPLGHEYTALMQGEILRAEVFAGNRTPLIFGQPPEWIALLLQSLKFLSEGKTAQATKLQSEALAAAPAQSGTINDEAFEWLADADSRLGPVMEAYIDGKYFWVPYTNIKSVSFDKPSDLRDLLWLPAKFTWTNDTVVLGYVPARYPNSEKSQDGMIALSRTTDWQDLGTNYQIGTGLRILNTDQNDYPLTTTRDIVFN